MSKSRSHLRRTGFAFLDSKDLAKLLDLEKFLGLRSLLVGVAKVEYERFLRCGDAKVSRVDISMDYTRPVDRL
jgi:hypothetical protein